MNKCEVFFWKQKGFREESVYTKGDIAVHGNLDAFKQASEKYIASINKDLKTDEDFVNAEAAIKRFKEVERIIKTAKSAMIGGISSVDEAIRVLDYIDDSYAKIRLTLEKLVKSQKENIKKNISGTIKLYDSKNQQFKV